MDAFCQNAGAPGTLPEEPGPSTYSVKYMRKHANPSPVRYVKPPRPKPLDNGIPGPASYTFPDGLGKQPLSQYKSPTSIKMTASKRVSIFDCDGSVPGPNAYGFLSLPSHGGGVQFGPLGGHREFNAPRMLRPSQQAAVDANKRMPGPGAYQILSSVGKQVESNKRSPAQVSFGSSTRKQRTKMYMGHGVTTVEATLGQGAGYKYSHPDMPMVLRPHSPSTHFGRNVVVGDVRLLRVRQRRQELETLAQENKDKEKLQKRLLTPQFQNTINNYDWLRPATVFGGSRTGSRRGPVEKRFDGADLPRSRPFSRNPAIKFGSDRRFNEKMHMPHSPSTAVGLTAPGPMYDLPPLPMSPGARFPEFTKRTVEILQDRVRYENIPGPGAYNTSIEQRMDAVTADRDQTDDLVKSLEYQVQERESLVSETHRIVEDFQNTYEKLKGDMDEDEKLLYQLRKQVAMEKEMASGGGGNNKRRKKKKNDSKPGAEKEEEVEETTEIKLQDAERRAQKRMRAMQLKKRAIKEAKEEHTFCVNDFNEHVLKLRRMQRKFNRLNGPLEDVVSMKYGPDPRVHTPGTVCMATGTRDASKKMHQPNMKINPEATLDVPGPASYNVTGNSLNASGGGRFSTAFPMDDVEWVMLRASKLPAPNEYTPVPVMGKVPISSIRSAPSLIFATAGRDARKKWYFPGAPSDRLGTESPGPQYLGRPSMGPQVLSTIKNSAVIKIFSGKGMGPQSSVDQVPGPGAYRPPHQVYSSAVKRLRKKSPLDSDRPIVNAQLTRRGKHFKRKV